MFLRLVIARAHYVKIPSRTSNALHSAQETDSAPSAKIVRFEARQTTSHQQEHDYHRKLSMALSLAS